MSPERPKVTINNTNNITINLQVNCSTKREKVVNILLKILGAIYVWGL